MTTSIKKLSRECAETFVLDLRKVSPLTDADAIEILDFMEEEYEKDMLMKVMQLQSKVD
jgi:hypothetical protein